MKNGKNRGWTDFCSFFSAMTRRDTKKRNTKSVHPFYIHKLPQLLWTNIWNIERKNFDLTKVKDFFCTSQFQRLFPLKVEKDMICNGISILTFQNLLMLIQNFKYFEYVTSRINCWNFFLFGVQLCVKAKSYFPEAWSESISCVILIFDYFLCHNILKTVLTVTYFHRKIPLVTFLHRPWNHMI